MARAPFGMFDYTPVGLAVALGGGGLLFIILIGRFFVPVRKQSGIEGFESGAYLTEARVGGESKAVGLSLREVEQQIEETGAQVVGLVHHDVRLTAPNPRRKVRAGDILIIEAEAEELSTVLSSLGLKLEEAKEAEDAEAGEAPDKPDAQAAKPRSRLEKKEEAPSEEDAKAESSGDIVLMELAVMPTSSLAGCSASDLSLRTRYGLNLLAISRHGQRSLKRLRAMAIRRGDLLLLQGPPEAISEFASDHGCVPLAERELLIPDRRKAWAAGLILLLANGTAAAGLLPVAIAASCAFLTPIGHQNNTLILGPGGFRFGDYWKLGGPLEIIVVVISIPLLLLVWPL